MTLKCVLYILKMSVRVFLDIPDESIQLTDLKLSYCFYYCKTF